MEDFQDAYETEDNGHQAIDFMRGVLMRVPSKDINIVDLWIRGYMVKQKKKDIQPYSQCSLLIIQGL